MENKNKTEIFKIQKALNNNFVLIYNKDKSIMGQFIIDKSLKKLFGTKYKIYVMGKYNDVTTKIEIDHKITNMEELNTIDW